MLTRAGRLGVIVLAVVALAANAASQRRGRFFGFGSPSVPANPSYDGGFIFCRIQFEISPRHLRIAGGGDIDGTLNRK